MTYEAHKEYLAKMYEEYQRQEEQNIKKGTKGLVSTISGLSAQSSGINGNIDIREMDENSPTPDSETDYECSNALEEGKPIMEALQDVGKVEVDELLVDIKAEKVEATEVKLDDLDLSAESENRSLVEVDSLLDKVYSAAVKKLNSKVKCGLLSKSNIDEQNMPPLISLDDDKDSIPSNFLFGSLEDKLLGPSEPLVLPSPNPQAHNSEPLGLLAPMAVTSQLGHLPSILEKDEFDLQATLEGIGSAAGNESEASSESPQGLWETAASEGSRMDNKTDGAAEITSNTCEAERTEDGKEKEMKIQTTATTQVSDANTFYSIPAQLHGIFNFSSIMKIEKKKKNR